jgi:hypothetical protein
MNLIFKNIVFSIFIVLLANACAGEPYEPVPIEERLAKLGYTISKQVKYIKDYRINSWISVDRYNVIINAGASEDYLITVRSPCEGLRSAGVLSFSTIVGELTDKDRLVVQGNGRYLENCYIDTIHKLTKNI